MNFLEPYCLQTAVRHTEGMEFWAEFCGLDPATSKAHWRLTNEQAEVLAEGDDLATLIRQLATEREESAKTIESSPFMAESVVRDTNEELAKTIKLRAGEGGDVSSGTKEGPQKQGGD